MNCIALGSMKHGDRPASAQDPEVERKMLRSYPVGRLGRVDDPAPLAVLLCSDAAEWITGQVYPRERRLHLGALSALAARPRELGHVPAARRWRYRG